MRLLSLRVMSSTVLAAAFNSLISVSQLKKLMLNPSSNVKVVDASWHLSGRDGKKEHEISKIPGSVFFDINEISDKFSSLPHMLPSPNSFSTEVSNMGISNDSIVVVYNTKGCFSAARCWWTFKVFGHDNVCILQGGLPAWMESGEATESGSMEESILRSGSSDRASGVTRKVFEAVIRKEMVKSWNEERVRSATIVDARSRARFLGEAPEPRAGVRGGHIPNSLCVPFTDMMENSDYTSFKSVDEIKKVFDDSGIDIHSSMPIITSCGTGVSAAVLSFALHLAGRDCSRTPVYDGSWTEWGGRNDLPVEL